MMYIDYLSQEITALGFILGYGILEIESHISVVQLKR